MESRLRGRGTVCVLVIAVCCAGVCLARTATTPEGKSTAATVQTTTNTSSSEVGTTQAYKTTTGARQPLLGEIADGVLGGKASTNHTTEHSTQTTAPHKGQNTNGTGAVGGTEKPKFSDPGTAGSTSALPVSQGGNVTASGGGSEIGNWKGSPGGGGGQSKYVNGNTTMAPSLSGETTVHAVQSRNETGGGTGGGGGLSSNSAPRDPPASLTPGSSGIQTTNGRIGTGSENTKRTGSYTTPSSLRNTTDNGTFISPNANKCFQCHAKECENLTINDTCQSATKSCYVFYNLEISAVTLGCKPLMPSSQACKEEYLHAATSCEYCCKTLDYCNGFEKLRINLKAWCTGNNGGAITSGRLGALWVFSMAVFVFGVMRNL